MPIVSSTSSGPVQIPRPAPRPIYCSSCGGSVIPSHGDFRDRKGNRICGHCSGDYAKQERPVLLHCAKHSFHYHRGGVCGACAREDVGRASHLKKRGDGRDGLRDHIAETYGPEIDSGTTILKSSPQDPTNYHDPLPLGERNTVGHRFSDMSYLVRDRSWNLWHRTSILLVCGVLTFGILGCITLQGIYVVPALICLVGVMLVLRIIIVLKRRASWLHPDQLDPYAVPSWGNLPLTNPYTENPQATGHHLR